MQDYTVTLEAAMGTGTVSLDMILQETENIMVLQNNSVNHEEEVLYSVVVNEAEGGGVDPVPISNTPSCSPKSLSLLISFIITVMILTFLPDFKSSIVPAIITTET